MPLVDPTAKQSTFEKFYHYQPFNRDYLTATLCDQKLFFSHPHSVNDPWDCKPCFDHRPLLADPAKRKEMIMYLRSALPPEILNDPRRPILESLILSDDNALREAVERSSQILIEQIGMRRIYCLTPFPDSTLMWSHYAANHRGICLEFDKNNPLIAKARPVRYRKTYPEWTPQMSGDNILELVLTKSADWHYEREFRLIGTLAAGPLKLEGDFVHLPVGALTAIILGCANQDYTDIHQIVREHAPSLTIRRVVRVPNQYKLAVEG
jgi:hypothetical protein